MPTGEEGVLKTKKKKERKQIHIFGKSAELPNPRQETGASLESVTPEGHLVLTLSPIRRLVHRPPTSHFAVCDTREPDLSIVQGECYGNNM